MKKLLTCLLIALFAAIAAPQSLFAAEKENAIQKAEDKVHESEAEFSPKEIIFEHLGDAYGWEVPFNHHKRIPLPIIVKTTDGWHVFSSRHLEHNATYTDGGATFTIAGKTSPYKGKVVQIVDGKEVKPSVDISITKNVAGMWIGILLVVCIMLWMASFHKRSPGKAPRKGLGFVEVLVTFIYDSVVKSTLQDNAKKFAPYLMTVFFFIFGMNLLGLIVVFPGGANLTGNIAVTMVLAILTFLMTNLFGTKHYWKEIFWPDVPIWLKFPIPIMQCIEIFGMFTKPAALTVRLFANMMGGHMIVLVLTLLIFIFAAMSPVVGGLTTVFSVLFSVFMLIIDVLVSFIQAYVFTMLSTIFIALAQEKGEHHDAKHHAEAPSANPEPEKTLALNK